MSYQVGAMTEYLQRYFPDGDDAAVFAMTVHNQDDSEISLLLLQSALRIVSAEALLPASTEEEQTAFLHCLAQRLPELARPRLRELFEHTFEERRSALRHDLEGAKAILTLLRTYSYTKGKIH